MANCYRPWNQLLLPGLEFTSPAAVDHRRVPRSPGQSPASKAPARFTCAFGRLDAAASAIAPKTYTHGKHDRSAILNVYSRILGSGSPREQH